MEPCIYVYKMTTDNGGAPCVRNALLSLAICKPDIRRMAKTGSIIFGFGGKDYDERLLYVARVTDKSPTGSYYRDSRYSKRPDCIYELGKDGKTPELRKAAKYHTKSDERKRDVGIAFEKADVLLSDDFRYFGRDGTTDYKKQPQFAKIRQLVEGMRQGYRVNHLPELRSQLTLLKEQMLDNNPDKTVGKPTESDRNKVCNR